MAEGCEIYNGKSPWLCPEMLRGPSGRGGSSPSPSVLPCRCCPPKCPPAKSPEVTPWDSSVLGAASQHSPPALIPAHGKRKIPSGTQLPALSSACPLFHPKPCGAIDPGKDFLLTRGALPGSGMTWAMGKLRAVLDQHPSSGIIPELLSSLSHVPPPSSFPFFQSLGYIFLIILLPALSGSPSPAITPDNCELSRGQGQQSGSSTWETAASTDTSLPSSPPPLPQLPHPSLLVQLWERPRPAGRGATRPNHPERSWGPTAPCRERCWQLGRCFWGCSAPVSRGEIAVPEGWRLPGCAALPGSCSHGHEQIPASPRKGIKWHHLALGELFPLPPVGRG